MPVHFSFIRVIILTCFETLTFIQKVFALEKNEYTIQSLGKEGYIKLSNLSRVAFEIVLNIL